MSQQVLVVDNYDSFVYNLVQYLGELGADPVVYRPEQLRAQALDELHPDRVVISPGPGRPEDAQAAREVIAHFAGRVPILGVCLGMQAIAVHYGAQVHPAPVVMHGKTSAIRHHDSGWLQGLPQPFEAIRYHSLVVDRQTLPEELEVTAVSDDDQVMGIRHRDLPVEGVQFHPESILTPVGPELLANFLRRVG